MDLNNQTWEQSIVEVELNAKYMGGRGLGVYYLAEHLQDRQRSDIKNPPLIFFTGPFAAAKIPAGDRLHAVSISPLTGVLAESDVGGRAGSSLISCGWGGILLKGAAEDWLWLEISSSGVNFHSAGDLLSRDTFELDEYFGHKFSEYSLLSIGRAGENKVKFASIMVDGRDARALGRAGLGAVMGDKKIKAIVIKRHRENLTRDLAKNINESKKQAIYSMRENMQAMEEYGTASGVAYALETGNFPYKNWQVRPESSDDFNILGENLAEEFSVNQYRCGFCPVGCGRELEKNEDSIAGPEYETIGLLGSSLLIKEISQVVELNEFCDREGLDTISTGGTIGLVLELNEKGILDHKYLEWGDGAKIKKLLEMIVKREGLGDILAEGTKGIAEEFNLSDKFDVNCKGLELPAHDPRNYASLYLGYATSNRGACHLQAFSHALESSATIPEIGYSEIMDKSIITGKEDSVIKMQNLMAIFDSLKLCKFMIYSEFSMKTLAQWWSVLTEINADLEDLLFNGARVFQLERLLNNFLGVTDTDDDLPERFFAEFGEGGLSKEKFYEARKAYYAKRGWDEQGVVKNSTAIRYDLSRFHNILE